MILDRRLPPTVTPDPRSSKTGRSNQLRITGASPAPHPGAHRRPSQDARLHRAKRTQHSETSPVPTRQSSRLCTCPTSRTVIVHGVPNGGSIRGGGDRRQITECHQVLGSTSRRSNRRGWQVRSAPAVAIVSASSSQGEVAGVEQDDLGAADVSVVGVRACRGEERVVAASDGRDLGRSRSQSAPAPLVQRGHLRKPGKARAHRARLARHAP
jgi:hypothetical protein